MAADDLAANATTAQILASGEGWRVVDIMCRSGPSDRPYEEQHDWISVSAVLSGVFTYRSRRGRAVLSPGSLLLGNAGTCFECGHEHGVGDRCLSFQCSPEMAEEAGRDLKELRRLEFGNVRIPPLEQLLPLFAEAHVLAGSADSLHAEELSLRIFRATFALDRDAVAPPGGSRDEARVAEAVRVIDAHYVDPFSIAQLAQAVGMRRRAFATAFRRVIGITLYNYVLNRRLDAATRLRQGRETVLEVALATGFGDLSVFTRRFRSRFGVPPAAFRMAARPITRIS